MKEKCFVRVKTEACDEYDLEFDHQPTNKEVAKVVWEKEGRCADLEFYEDTIQVKIIQYQKK